MFPHLWFPSAAAFWGFLWDRSHSSLSISPKLAPPVWCSTTGFLTCACSLMNLTVSLFVCEAGLCLTQYNSEFHQWSTHPNLTQPPLSFQSQEGSRWCVRAFCYAQESRCDHRASHTWAALVPPTLSRRRKPNVNLSEPLSLEPGQIRSILYGSRDFSQGPSATTLFLVAWNKDSRRRNLKISKLVTVKAKVGAQCFRNVCKSRNIKKLGGF